MVQEIRLRSKIMRFNKTKVLIAVVFSLCVSLVVTLDLNASYNNVPKQYIFSIDSKGIYRTDTTTNEKKTIFNTVGLYGVSFSLSPSDTIIAVLVTERGIVPPGAHDYSVLPKNSMVFIDLDGNEVARLDEDVRKFSWSPDGEKIAYIIGTYYEGGVGFKTTGVGIFDLKDKSKIRIKKDFPHRTIEGFIGGGIEINWARHDSNIYIRDFDYLDGIYRYNITTGKSEKVAYHGINFSPDGRYYLSISSMDYPHLYVSSTNEEITDRVKSKLGYVPRSWMPEQNHHMLAVKVEYKPSFVDTISSDKPRVMVDDRKVKQKTFFIYDVETDQIIKEWIEKPGE